MLPCRPLLATLSWCPIFKYCYQLRATVDFTHECPIFKWVAETWSWGTRIAVPPMAAGRHAPLSSVMHRVYSMKYTATGISRQYDVSVSVYGHGFLLFSFVVVIPLVLSRCTWSIYPWSSGLLHWHCGNHCLSASEVTLKVMAKFVIKTTTKHNKTLTKKSFCVWVQPVRGGVT